MMTEKYPTWLIGHVKEWAEKRLPTVILCSTTGNELLEVLVLRRSAHGERRTPILYHR